jgi:hypothetical protein
MIRTRRKAIRTRTGKYTVMPESKNNNYNTIPKTQRALVLQGGVALGAYEAGVYKALYQKLIKEDERNGEKDRPVFDNIVGTSIGAINAAIIVSHVIERKKANPNIGQRESWEGSAERLIDFWKYISSPTPNIVKWSTIWWNELYNKFNSNAASEEAARRYYSTKQFFISGLKKVFSVPDILYDERFFDNIPYTPPNNIWYRYSNTPLKESIKEFTKFPIKTSFFEPEEYSEDARKGLVKGPRLLTVTVDVAEGTAVTFDSYGKLKKDEKGKIITDEKGNRIYEWKTEYGRKNDGSNGYEHAIEYDQGIILEHVSASGAMPVLFDYEEIAGRKFWDGGILSNTPLRELIGKYKTFWEDEIDPQELEAGMWTTREDAMKEGQKVPNLEVYIVNVWPSKENIVPSDYDGVKDRHNDIRFHDKTEYDEKVAFFISDYIELVKQVRNIAVKHFREKNERDAFQKELGKFLSSKKDTKSTQRMGEKRKYEDLIKGRFDIATMVRIERKDDVDGVSSKFADFTIETIDKLIEEGEHDAWKALG